MTGEAFPGFEAFPQRNIFFEDGSINEDVLRQRFGIGIEEAMQEASFGGYKGTVGQMLADEKCPVGSMVETAYREQGIEGVEEKFRTLSLMDPNFKVEISPITLLHEQLKKK